MKIDKSKNVNNGNRREKREMGAKEGREGETNYKKKQRKDLD